MIAFCVLYNRLMIFWISFRKQVSVHELYRYCHQPFIIFLEIPLLQLPSLLQRFFTFWGREFVSSGKMGIPPDFLLSHFSFKAR